MEGSIYGQLIYLINVCFIFKKILKMCSHSKISMVIRGDPGFQVREVGGGAHLKKLRRAEGGAKFVWVFRVKNHGFTPKNHIFLQF